MWYNKSVEEKTLRNMKKGVPRMQPRRPVPPAYRTSQTARRRTPQNAAGARSSASRGAARSAYRHPGGRRRNPRARLIGFLAIAVLIGVIVFAIDTIAVLGVGEARFYNVTLNGISLKGYTKAEGYQLFSTLEAGWSDKVYTLTYGDHVWEFSPSLVNAELNEEKWLELAWNFGHVGNVFQRKSQVRALKDNPVAFTSEITYDEELLNRFIASIQAVTDKEPQDAVVVLGETAPVIYSESESGSRLDVDKLMETLNSLMLTGEGSTELSVDILEPAIDSSEASSSLKIIATCQTDTSSSRTNRVINIAVALGRFNAVTVEPGVEISFNEVVGERTTARGFKEAPEFSEGEVKNGIGGGTCQASTTLYGALLEAGMTIVRRSPHSMTVSYVEPSLDAAVTDTSSKDLVFRNDTDSPMYIYTNVNKSKATVVIYGKRPPYRYVIESKVLQDNIAPTREVTRVDTTGEYATYTDERVLGSTGKSGRVSEAYRVSYDWDTGEEVARDKLSTDTYSAGVTVYYVGTQEREVDAQIPEQIFG